MKKTGQLLKDKRESANLSLSEVALATKINPKILTAIEEGDEARLPAKTFLKGFVRSYALFLKMDVEEVLRCFQEESGGPPVERVHEAYKTDTPMASGSSRRRVGDENSSGMRTAAVVVIVVLIGLIIGVRELIEKYQREKIVESTANIKVSPLIQAPAQLEPAKEPEPSSAALSNNNAAPEPPPPPAQPEAKVAEKAPDKAPEAKPTVAKAEPPPPPPAPPPPVKPSPEKEAPVAEKPKAKAEVAADAVEAPKAPAKSVKNEIILEALDKVDVVMKIKGENKKLSLGPTQVHTIHSDQPVEFEFSDGGAVNIIFNGHERGVPGDLGKPKQITIP